ncbi:MAG: O-methyltransferase [Clostridiales bacterium]|jgi:caffeoyl-CoA O-methyltransferase|nr:O-methyltransferase [Clostridiales bacterium]
MLDMKIYEKKTNAKIIRKLTSQNIKKKSSAKDILYLLDDMKNFSEINNIPICKIEVINFISNLINDSQYKNILEIGTAIGYFAIHIQMLSSAKITTIELSKKMFSIAQKNIKKAKKNNKIKLILGEANEILTNLKNKYLKYFDLIFIDAAKSQYKKYFLNSVDLLKPSGVIICDNILFRGMVNENNKINKRYKTIVKNMKLFLEFLTKNKDFNTTIVPISDGLSISYKINKTSNKYLLN